MTYIELINDFWQEFESEAMPSNDALLYLFLLKVCNSKRWENPFELPNKRIRIYLEMTDKAIIQSRERLAERGLIKVTKGEKNRMPPTYNLLRVCFPRESKKGSKTESKNESRTGSRTESKTGNIIKDVDIDKDYYVVDAIRREEFFNIFFAESRRKTIESLCINNHIDEATLRRLSKEVLDDWQATGEPKHRDLHEAQSHLLNQIRIKLSIERREQKTQPNRPTTTNRDAKKAPRNVNESWIDFTMPTK